MNEHLPNGGDPGLDERNAVRPAMRVPHLRLAQTLGKLRAAVGGDRFDNLYRSIVQEIVSLPISVDRLLDYGCGSMAFSERLKDDGYVRSYLGVDTFPPPADTELKWKNYRQLEKDTLASLGSFDLTIVVDVLHHAAEDEQPAILRELAKSSRYVLVKDHFEHGPVSRQKLRLADWYGNYAYGVSIPDRYFTQQRWDGLVKAAGLMEIKRKPDVLVHDGLFKMILPPKHHFISTLTKPGE